ncbi:MAG: hypothetical protein AAGD22_05720 [Verrucomicrobiota bacterium]
MTRPDATGELRWWETWWAGLAMLALLALVFFFKFLFLPGDLVLSLQVADVYRQFAGWRHFGFSEIASGNFPLWTPMVYGGMPYFSGFQSALLYPPNWIFAVLPLAKAINWSIAFHSWWLASGVYLWLRLMGTRQAAAVFGGICLMFSAPFFLHIYAGHLTNLCVMAWIPWLILCIHGWEQSRHGSWVIFGGFVVAMQILAGHPQYVYYTGLVVSLYVILTTFISIKERRGTFLAGFMGMYLLGALLSAAQLLPGLEASGEGVRSGGTGKEFAGSYSFPPSNLLSILVPGVFGDEKVLRYWGYWLYWEMIAFCGVIALCFAMVGLFARGERRRERTVLGIVGAVALILAMGKYTLVFDVFYQVVPGFSLFRGTSKFIFFFALMVSVLAGLGADFVLAKPDLRKSRRLLVSGGIGLAILWGLGGIIRAGDGESGLWTIVRRAIWKGGDVTHVNEETYFAEEFGEVALRQAANGFWMAGLMVLIFILGVTAMRRRPIVGYVLLAFGVVELLFFAGKHQASFALSTLNFGVQEQSIGGNPDDLRALDVTGTNRGMITGISDLWGDDPGVIKRYAEFMTATQGLDPDNAGQHVPLNRPHAAWRLLRGEYVFQRGEDGGVALMNFSTEPLRRFELIPNYLVLADRDVILNTVLSESFEPLSQVVLEEEPGVTISGASMDGPIGSWEIESEDTDEIIVSVETARPAILLMTDPFSKGWRVKRLGKGGAQEDYRIIPANYALRGIPLAEGIHRLKIYYWPRTLGFGIVVSLLAAVGSVIYLLWFRRKHRRTSRK